MRKDEKEEKNESDSHLIGASKQNQVKILMIQTISFNIILTTSKHIIEIAYIMFDILTTSTERIIQNFISREVSRFIGSKQQAMS